MDSPLIYQEFLTKAELTNNKDVCINAISFLSLLCPSAPSRDTHRLLKISQLEE